MELYNVEILLKKYFEGETTINEEKELHHYFLSQEVAPHLVQYTSIFEHFTTTKTQQFQQEIPVFDIAKVQNRDKIRNAVWLSIAASVIILLGIGTYVFNNSEPVNTGGNLGTYDDPEVAFKATQKALSLLSNNVNVGIASVRYVEEYQIAKNKVFWNPNDKSGGI